MSPLRESEIKNLFQSLSEKLAALDIKLDRALAILEGKSPPPEIGDVYLRAGHEIFLTAVNAKWIAAKCTKGCGCYERYWFMDRADLERYWFRVA